MFFSNKLQITVLGMGSSLCLAKETIRNSLLQALQLNSKKDGAVRTFPPPKMFCIFIYSQLNFQVIETETARNKKRYKSIAIPGS